MLRSSQKLALRRPSSLQASGDRALTQALPLSGNFKRHFIWFINITGNQTKAQFSPEIREKVQKCLPLLTGFFPGKGSSAGCGGQNSRTRQVCPCGFS